jgi:hypothetical protein
MWVFRIMNNQWCAEAIRILAPLVAVIPICPWLVDLFFVSTDELSLSLYEDYGYNEEIQAHTMLA